MNVNVSFDTLINSGNKVQKKQYFPRKQKKEQEHGMTGGMRMMM